MPFRRSAGLDQLGPRPGRSETGPGLGRSIMKQQKRLQSDRITIKKLQYFYGRNSQKRSVSLPKLKFLEDDKP
jgi:hypothetical protein